MLSVYIYEGIFALRIYVAITSPYPWDPGVTSWYQSLGSHIFSTTSWQINDILICNWRAQVLDIHSNRKCGVIYFFLAIYFLDPETLLSFSLQLFPDIPSTNSDTERWGTRNGPGTSRDSSNRERATWWGYFMAWWRVSISRQSFCDKCYWQHLESRGLVMYPISEDYSRLYIFFFGYWEAIGHRTVANWYYKSYEGSSNPRWEPGGSG